MKHCIPAEEKAELQHELHGNMKEREKLSFKQILGSDEEEKSAKKRKV